MSVANIQVMDTQLANLIAAGEVVERPASVVKELVENAIDAGSTRIEVHLEEGGLTSIRVVDNGCGMVEADCRLAFERHATSKLKRERDLSHIRTLGFRGEALPSIAAVSRTEIKSTARGEQGGTRIRISGGTEEVCEPVAFPRGTEVVISDLFYNTPARLKYMKTIHTEVGHVSDVMNRLALSHPNIAFLLTHNQKQLLRTSGDGQLLHVIAAVYGMNLARSMVQIEAESLDFRLSGYLAKPEITRASRSYISTLINGRYIRSMGLTNAILRGYHTLLPINRYPIAVLSLEMEPTLVDVNVHPAKLEVRFSKDQELYAFVEREVKQVWSGQRLIPEPGRNESAGPRPKNNEYQASMDWTLFVPDKEEKRLVSAPDPEWRTERAEGQKEDSVGATETGNRWELPDFSASSLEQEEKEAEASLYHTEPGSDYVAEHQETASTMDEPATAPQVSSSVEHEEQDPAGYERKEEARNLRVPEMYALGQLHGTYILAQNQDGMFMIDQHAAQERIFYEYFLNKLHEEAIESQELLIPITLELTAAEAAAVDEGREWFERVGVHMEPFGTNSYIIRSHPRWLPRGEEEGILREMVDMVLTSKKGIDVVKLREAAAITMSCKAAIKANRYLNHAEIEALIERLRRTSSPFTCPHGRPIIIHFSTYDIEKMFKRVM
ncbi:DNA mismatch repair endonuclease MutL [Aneurinibacillus aneurinilyticus]|uniref:DNA mismatch repair protein MutL n=1 Tax=Aneurinibacillus aneurinilyticus ATCC 12856 TaxID=649747 RepID=U1WI81_ANEAE|nr:DNA mismatch repair endonuclease MutL [Aneurinibacillus aneurinilyticus]ERI08264.1 DNA mismatch repair protein [Aneurinibacillus aneurinilyticus ATCC 12856]MED0725848.1 DNA mismatch repair endonuclease MutL [Aneurinibacillus aneurinilyticus]MED0732195.1 DNA mismatch repair endonuclease MutL [Aneurinibacillus aneurinilyticus]